MPPLTRLFVKTALAYFVAALLLALAQALLPLLPGDLLAAGFGPVYFHLFMVGWVTQLIMGVAYWMFPKYTRERPRGHDSLMWATYWLLNTGLILRAVAEPAAALWALPLWGFLLVLSALLQWLGGLAFVANLWPRAKEK